VTHSDRVFMVPTHRPIERTALERHVAEIEHARHTLGERIPLVIVENRSDNRDLVYEVAAEHPQLDIYRLDDSDLAEFQEALKRQLHPPSKAALDSISDTGVLNYGNVFNRLYLVASAMGARYLHRRDSDTYAQENEGRLIPPLDLEMSFLGKVDTEGMTCFMVGGSYTGKWSIDIDHLIHQPNREPAYRFFRTLSIEPEDFSLYQIYLCPERTTSIGDGFTVRTVSLDAGETEVLADIRTCRPRILWGFASYFLRLRRTFGNGLRELGIQAVITNSEASSRLERRLLSEAFGCPVYDEYSSEELYLIATERLCEQYHLVEDSVRVDVIDPDGSGIGRLCGTSLVDAGFPMIRYEQGDVGRITESSEPRGCECGSHARILDRFQGRADQHLVLTGGGVLEGDRLMLLYDENLLPAQAGLRAFRIIQEQAGSATLVAVAESSDAVVAWEKFRSDIERMTEGRLMMQVEWVDQLPHIPGTKRRLVFSSVPETMQSPLPGVQQVEG